MATKVVDWSKRVKRIRAAREWSRDQLGEAIGWSGRTVEGWESGRHYPDRRARAALRLLWRVVKREIETAAMEAAEAAEVEA